MLRVIIRIILKALVIVYVFPLLPGTKFHGDLLSGCALAIFFSVLLSFMEMLSTLFAGALTISTFGIALLVIIPVRILFFWTLPTLSLVIVAHCFPSLITIQNWIGAALAALILLAIGLITHDKKH